MSRRKQTSNGRKVAIGQRIDVPRALRKILSTSGINESERRMLLAAVMLADPYGAPAEECHILAIAGNAVAVAERLGHDPIRFVLDARKRVFGSNYAKSHTPKRRKRAEPRSTRRFQLGEDDAALVIRSDGSYEIYDPSWQEFDEAASLASWTLECLAHFASDPDLMCELDARFDRYLRDNIDGRQSSH